MKTNLADGAEALGSIVWFLKEFVDALDRAGGNESLKDITAQFNELAKFLATDEGTKAMEGLLHTIQILAFFFIALVNDVIIFLFLLEVTAEFIKNGLLPALGDFFAWAGEGFVNWIKAIGAAIADFFTNTIPEFFTWLGGYIMGFFNDLFMAVGGFIQGIFNLLGSLLGWIISQIFNITGAIATWIHDRAADIADFFGSLGSRIANIAGDMWNVLYQAGRNLIGGLLNGVKSMFGPIADVAAQVVSKFRNVLPFSPAKEGPLSGSGDPMIAGQKIVDRLAAGIEMETPKLQDASIQAANSVLVGANAVQMNFYGAPPTQQQAAGIGAAAGNSLADTIARRDTRLAIRTIGTAAAPA
jgi:phage-related protein